jgi:hypothetical protein
MGVRVLDCEGAGSISNVVAGEGVQMQQHPSRKTSRDTCHTPSRRLPPLHARLRMHTRLALPTGDVTGQTLSDY